MDIGYPMHWYDRYPCILMVMDNFDNNVHSHSNGVSSPRVRYRVHTRSQCRKREVENDLEDIICIARESMVHEDNDR